MVTSVLLAPGMALYIAYAWLQVSQLGSANATYDIYDSDNYPLVRLMPPPRPPPPYPLPSYISLLKPVATCRGTFCCTSLVHVMAASGQMMSGRCQRHCIACIYHAALASCCVRQVLLASTPAYLCQAFRSTFNVFFDTALASGESPLCKAGVHTCRRAIHLSRG